MVDDNNNIEPINADFDDVAKSIIQGAPLKTIKNNEISKGLTMKGAPSKQYVLDLGIEIQKDVNGIEMGVLENGIPYLTQIGLSEISGAPRKQIYNITNDWEENYDNNVIGKDRISFLKTYLFENGYFEPKLYIETKKDGATHYAYPDLVCMAIIEYYAFEAKVKNEKAIENYRNLARFGLQKFIYESLEYKPLDKWHHHNARQSILRNTVPSGYFSVFHEINPLTLDLIHANLPINDKTVPDISVGQSWAIRWKEISDIHSSRIPFSCPYPDTYRQSKANEFIQAKAYPDTALPEFRRWFREEYLTTKFPKYILTKANVLAGGKDEAMQLAALFEPKKLKG